MAALRCRSLPEGAALEPMVRHMWLHIFAVTCSLLEPPVALVVLVVVLLRSAPMYPVLGVCCGGVRLYRVVVDLCFIYKAGRKPFSVKSFYLSPQASSKE